MEFTSIKQEDNGSYIKQEYQETTEPDQSIKEEGEYYEKEIKQEEYQERPNWTEENIIKVENIKKESGWNLSGENIGLNLYFQPLSVKTKMETVIYCRKLINDEDSLIQMSNDTFVDYHMHKQGAWYVMALEKEGQTEDDDVMMMVQQGTPDIKTYWFEMAKKSITQCPGKMSLLKRYKFLLLQDMEYHKELKDYYLNTILAEVKRKQAELQNEEEVEKME